MGRWYQKGFLTIWHAWSHWEQVPEAWGLHLSQHHSHNSALSRWSRPFISFTWLIKTTKTWPVSGLVYATAALTLCKCFGHALGLFPKTFTGLLWLCTTIQWSPTTHVFACESYSILVLITARLFWAFVWTTHRVLQQIVFFSCFKQPINILHYRCNSPCCSLLVKV